LKYELDKHRVLNSLKAYHGTITEFDEEEMDYLIDLVDRDIELEESVKGI